ncbi:hypothetical protein EDD18DRAFT_1098830 [Armillaria luteobubalina]|uniref:Uncharacterized protein n=1 Tax=Armillaria luteobubalina TaxID=153913 RepID=A0AA39QNB7_9AGAR|nr:hypothetical protein EDD18DRAFT_1098830 [Armillaria luteobubalina]
MGILSATFRYVNAWLKNREDQYNTYRVDTNIYWVVRQKARDMTAKLNTEQEPDDQRLVGEYLDVGDDYCLQVVAGLGPTPPIETAISKDIITIREHDAYLVKSPGDTLPRQYGGDHNPTTKSSRDARRSLLEGTRDYDFLPERAHYQKRVFISPYDRAATTSRELLSNYAAGLDGPCACALCAQSMTIPSRIDDKFARLEEYIIQYHYHKAIIFPGLILADCCYDSVLFADVAGNDACKNSNAVKYGKTFFHHVYAALIEAHKFSSATMGDPPGIRAIRRAIQPCSCIGGAGSAVTAACGAIGVTCMLKDGEDRDVTFLDIVRATRNSELDAMVDGQKRVVAGKCAMLQYTVEGKVLEVENNKKIPPSRFAPMALGRRDL